MVILVGTNGSVGLIRLAGCMCHKHAAKCKVAHVRSMCSEEAKYRSKGCVVGKSMAGLS